MTLSPLQAEIEGSWVAPSGPNRQWHGVVRADAPCALLLLARLPHAIVWAKAGSKAVAEVPIQFTVHPVDFQGGVQLMLHAGDGWIQDVVVRLLALQQDPVVCLRPVFEVGVIHDLFVADSEPPASLGMLFLRRTDVTIGRTGIWRPRNAALAELPNDLHAIMNGGRKGAVSLA